MKRILLVFFLVLSFACSKSEAKKDTNGNTGEKTTLQVRFATYNIAYDTPKEKDNLWVDRAPIMVDLIKKEDFDIWGTQEGLGNQLADLIAGLPQYQWFGAGRTDGHAGEHCAIFYKPAKFEKLTSGDFWLSATPDNPSIGWDASLPRICTWGQFKDKATGAVFFVFNTHLDDKGALARQESLTLILSKIKQIAGNTPACFCGDFNFDQFDGNYATMKANMTDAYDIAKILLNETGGSYNGFNINHSSASRIDDVFLTPGISCQKYEIVNNIYNGKYPSDHFPVQVDLSIND